MSCKQQLQTAESHSPMSISDLPVVTLKARRALPFFSKHPWVFATAIASVSGSPDVGAEVVLKSNKGEFVARGLYNPHSKIRVRLYSWNTDQPCDQTLWKSRIEQAVQFREKHFEASPALQACRLIFSEGDGLSGLVVDRVGDWLVSQWTSAALVTQQAAIIDLLNERLKPLGIWQRTEKGMSELEGLSIQDGLLSGDKPPQPIVIEENGLEFAVDLIEGQKTGFYFDQRENRRQAAHYARGNVLDVCCYSGSFAINTAKSSVVQKVTGVDSSESALELARKNAERNKVTDHTEFVNSQAVPYLEQVVGFRRTV